ncbi:NAD-dependent epimerase/dehydratase family protein [Compostimonas suwonensis]|uniref:Nucleoside-diphosphate-sugar epimerase n=1 Tax=Compostimonas suwonensis TaxID=1048394 RepID=A0A2M9BWH2_9MICO|nr:NAD-dependent epimerase/dehydratase family protein [Compostimonas suwonensis]PJJ62298.1 nucleoside-diphosphate-sugar epimerase [Compostimonas suwonensis]
MSSLSLLLIGGTGVISSACARRAVDAGHEVHLLTRGESSLRPAPEGALLHTADVRDRRAVESALDGLSFDAVVNFVAFEPAHVQADIELFAGRTGQYVFISSTSAYQKPAAVLPITESTPLRNPYLSYSRAKIECEDVLVQAYRRSGFPVTIVRPSFTYDHTIFPIDGGWTVVDRMRRGLEVILPGDGSSLCSLTHASDFAETFVELLGDPRTIGDSYHITTDERLTWRQAFEAIAAAAGVEPRFVSVPSEAIAAADPEWGAVLLGDKTHSAFFDNSKVRGIVPGHHARIPYWKGARETVAWYDANPQERRIDDARSAVMDELAERFRP